MEASHTAHLGELHFLLTKFSIWALIKIDLQPFASVYTANNTIGALRVA